MNHFAQVFRFGWPYLRRYWGRLLAGALFGVLFGVTNAGFVWATGTLVDRLGGAPRQTKIVPIDSPAPSTSEGWRKSSRDWAQRFMDQSHQRLDAWLPRAGVPVHWPEDWRRILGAALLLPLLVSLRSGAEYGNGYCLGWVSERVINDLRLDVLGKLSGLSLEFFTRSSTGDLLTRINIDTANLLRCLRLGAADLVKEPITFVSVLATLFVTDWKLTLVVMVFVPVCLLPLLVLGRKVRRASRKSRHAGVLQASQLVELIGNIRIIKAYNLERPQIERYRRLSRDLVRQGMKSLRAKELTNPFIEVISMLGLGVLIAYVFASGAAIGDFVRFITGVLLLFLPIKKLARVHILFEQAAPGVQRLLEIFAEKPTVLEPIQAKPWPKFASEIRLEQISFAYVQQPVLVDFDLVIPRGHRIGIAGESGSGKSTLVNLLFRFYDPTRGRILIDGLDLREISVVNLREHMALVSQDVVLFDASVADNIAAGKPGATREDIISAAQSAFAHEFILGLPQQYQTQLGERGATLSGGQRQRIAIARAFVRNAPILVLDEATASLDSKAEAEVQAAIERLEKNRTVICVAHRLSTLAEMDWIVVLSQGRLIEQGSFNDLVEAGGPFADMARRQGITAALIGDR